MAADPFEPKMTQLFDGAYYLQFLEEIDAGNHEVSDWEASFLEHMLQTRPRMLSVKQHAVVQRMARQYLKAEV